MLVEERQGAGGRHAGFSISGGFILRKWKKVLILGSHENKAFLNIISFKFYLYRRYVCSNCKGPLVIESV